MTALPVQIAEKAISYAEATGASKARVSIHVLRLLIKGYNDAHPTDATAGREICR